MDLHNWLVPLKNGSKWPSTQMVVRTLMLSVPFLQRQTSGNQ